MRSLEEILRAIADRIRDPGKATSLGPPSQGPFNPVTPETIEETQRRLGFHLPPILQRLYTEIGNGGFGPGYGLLTLTPISPAMDRSIPTLYVKIREARKLRGAEWRAGTIPLASWGDLILSCIDISDVENEDPPVIRFEPNMPDLATHQYLKNTPYRGAGLIPEAARLSAWFSDWLDEVEMFERPYGL